jgi:amidase
VAARKREEIMSRIPQEWRLSKDVLERARCSERLVGSFMESLLDTETREITQLDCKGILDRITKGDLSATQAVRAFCKRTAFAHQMVNMSASVLEYCKES